MAWLRAPATAGCCRTFLERPARDRHRLNGYFDRRVPVVSFLPALLEQI